MTMNKQPNALKTAELEKISHLDYFNIAISVDCVIFCYDEKELKVLAIKSDLREFSGMYSLLGDLVRPDEDLDAASYRILEERTGMEDVYLEQVHTFGSIDRHPSGRVITTAYYSLIDRKHQKLQLTHNDLQWIPVNSIRKMAFDHKKILDTCLDRLREQVMDHPIIFNLLPEKFSLRELQELYEAILGVDLDRRNFRKKIAIKDWLIDLNEMEEDVPHRPGKLYKLKPEFRKKTGR
ncbi:MAG TPA: NUDIX domain-containing protein, partial [Chitinophagaceae bacterium]|nr:NUDIX domain-containing protein [Chitinophagaceae bacterium]